MRATRRSFKASVQSRRNTTRIHLNRVTRRRTRRRESDKRLRLTRRPHRRTRRRHGTRVGVTTIRQMDANRARGRSSKDRSLLESKSSLYGRTDRMFTLRRRRSIRRSGTRRSNVRSDTINNRRQRAKIRTVCRRNQRRSNRTTITKSTRHRRKGRNHTASNVINELDDHGTLREAITRFLKVLKRILHDIMKRPQNLQHAHTECSAGAKASSEARRR